MNNVDATLVFRHVPSVNSACNIQLIGSLYCDNRTVLKNTNAWELNNTATLELTS